MAPPCPPPPCPPPPCADQIQSMPTSSPLRNSTELPQPSSISSSVTAQSSARQIQSNSPSTPMAEIMAATTPPAAEASMPARCDSIDPRRQALRTRTEQSVAADAMPASQPSGAAADEPNANADGVQGLQSATTSTLPPNPVCPRQRYRGKRPREGKNYRIAPNEETAMAKAIRTASSRPGHPIFYPYEGTTFNSVTEAKHFYNLYSWEKGFGVRLCRGKKNRKGYILHQDIVCSCEGHDRNAESASIRTDCMAKIRLLRGPDGSYYIKTVNDEHNHRLTEAYEENKQWPSHGDLDPTTKHFIKQLRENNVSLSRVCNILGVSGNATASCIRKEAVRSWCAKLSQSNLVDDIGKSMKLLEEMKSKDPLLETRFKIDTEGKMNAMLWCTGKNRWDYSNFGDVITFDTTYRTNLYSLPFGMFVGVNNHFQTVIFGGVLFTTEKTEDFHWAFSQFIDIMGGKAPITLLTDQCAAMAKARRTAMPNTRHRWCRWHVLKDAKKFLGHYFSKYSTFKKEFKSLVTFVTDKAEFEKLWKQLQTKYQLTKNKFLNRLFKYRERWAKPYFMQDFCAGMTSTQRSESANHMIKTIIQKAAPMHLFVSKFTEFQSARKSDESTENFGTFQVSRKLTTRIPIESHANAVYTKAMYHHFSNQLYESGSFIVKDKPTPRHFVLIDVRLEGSDIARDIHVTLEEDDYIKCDCGLYEHMGMLCRHAIKVLTNLDKRQIPAKNILQRWTKCYDHGNNNTEYLQQLAIENDDLKKKALVSKAFELANRESKLSNFTYKQVMEALTDATNSSARRPASAQNEVAMHRGTENIPTSLPPSTFKGGRPPNTSQKSWLEKIHKEKRQKDGDAEKEASDWPREENPPTKKRRSISDMMKA